MPKKLGPYLLGWRAPEPDPRDFKAEHYLTGTPLDGALATLLASTSVAAATKNFGRAVVNAIEGTTPAPTPTPPSPTSAVMWTDASQLDQGNTGHCVGFGWAQFGNSLPVFDNYANADGNAIYYEAKVFDGEPNQENGSSVHSGAKAMVARKRIGAYAWTQSLDTIKQWLLKKGPVVVGTDWLNDMFEPDPDGLMHVSGPVEGGHCYILAGYNPNTDILTAQNSWGEGWGRKGYADMRGTDFAKLLNSDFEACVVVELPK